MKPHENQVLTGAQRPALCDSCRGTHTHVKTADADIGWVWNSLNSDASLSHKARILVVLRDATERRLIEARIQYLAYYDTLTGSSRSTALRARIAARHPYDRTRCDQSGRA